MQLCRRCLVMHPLAVAVAVAEVAGAVPSAWEPWLLWLAPIGVVVDWVLEQFGAVRYSPRRQIVVSGVGALSLGIALGRHARHPFDLQATGAMAAAVAICVLVWAGAVRTGRRAQHCRSEWAADFERAELERTNRLQLMLERHPAPGSCPTPVATRGESGPLRGHESNAVTKSMSSSTAPTSDGSRSL